MDATLASTGTLAVDARETVLTDVYQYALNPHANYDVAADGRHFIFLQAVGQSSVIVATNWTSLIGPAMRGVTAR
jgi:hypothetical protein